MKVFLLYQTDKWQTKTTRVCFGVFESHDKAEKIAELNGLYLGECGVHIEERKLNEFGEN